MAKKPAKKTATKKAPAKKAAKPVKAVKKAVKAVKKAVAVKEVKPKKVRVSSKPKNGSTLSYTQTEFLENVRAFCGLQKRSEAKELCDDMSLFIKDALKKGYKLPLMGLGKLYVRKTKPRMGRNPATGEIIHIGSKKRVRFTAAKALKDSVL
jgi:DNA-binding protein HU-beta